MDQATLFLLYVSVALSLWLVGSFAPSLLLVVSRIGVLLPVGRRVVAVAISVILLAGVLRVQPASATVGPAGSRMVKMAETSIPVASEAAIGVLARTLMATVSESYTVTRGDSLRGIARSVLVSNGAVPTGTSISDLWRAIYEANRDVIGDDPDLIHPGQVLELPAR